MATITSTGIGSGIDIESIVTKLVQVEGQARTTQLATKEAALQAKISAFGSFKSAFDALKSTLQPLKDTAKFQGRQVSVGDTDILSATATSSAAPGSYSVEVQNLAAPQKLVSKPLGSTSSVIGTGVLTITAAGQAITVNIDPSNNTLAGIRDAINAASNTSGVSAALISANDGAHLVLSGRSTGIFNKFSVAASGGDGGLSALSYTALSGTTANYPTVTDAQNARVKIDGFTVESATNTVADAITGVSLSVSKKSEVDTPTTVTVGYDAKTARQSIQAFVQAYNNLINNAKNATAYDSKTQKAGALLGDATLRGATASIRRELGQIGDVNANLRVLSDIGITGNLDGTLSVDATKLDVALNSNFDAVGRLFSGAKGLATRLDILAEGYTRTGGLIELRTKGFDTSVADIATQRQKLSDQLKSFETRLRAQYNALDSTVSQLKSTANYLTQLSNATATKTGA